jgi:hypothetical protein
LENLFKDKHSGAVNYKDALRTVEFCTEKECWIVRDPNAKPTMQDFVKDAFYKTAGHSLNQSIQVSQNGRRMSE